MLIKLEFNVNGFNSKTSALKLLILNNFIKKIELKSKKEIVNKNVILNSPFHYKLPKSHLGIYNNKLITYYYIKDLNLISLFNFLSEITEITFILKKKIYL